MSAIDLRPYGMNWIIDPAVSKDVMPFDFDARTQHVSVQADSFIFASGSVYRRGRQLGAGTFGTTYECVRVSDGKMVVVKLISMGPLRNFVKESIINIVICEKTRTFTQPEINLTGPFAPEVFEIGTDPATGQHCIVSQAMHATIFRFLRGRAAQPDQIDAEFPGFMIQVATMMDYLNKNLGFNHRDFKTDNAMYIRDARGRIQARLIDFGFSCIKFDGIYVNGGGYDFKHCLLGSRDLTQFIYELYTYHPYLGRNLIDMLKSILTFPGREGNVCYMYKGDGCGRMKAWKDTYKFLNSGTIKNVNGTPAAVRSLFVAFSLGKNWRAELKYVPGAMVPVAKPVVPVVCPTGKIFNPDTRRCVSLTGALGRKLKAKAVVNAAAVAALVAAAPAAAAAARPGVAAPIKACPATKPEYNPKTKRCVKTCPTGMVRNAITFKCRKVLGARPVVAPVAPAFGIAAPCPPSAPERNPKTKRCVKACGPGKKRNATTFKCVSDGTKARGRKVKAKAKAKAKA